MAATAKEYVIGKEPKKIVLKGDPQNPESAEHIIVFPGGSISVCRTSDNNYWAHVSVNKELVDGAGERQSKVGTIEVIRIDTADGVKQVEPVDTDHFAVLVCTNTPTESTRREPIREGTQLKLI